MLAGVLIIKAAAWAAMATRTERTAKDFISKIQRMSVVGKVGVLADAV